MRTISLFLIMTLAFASLRAQVDPVIRYYDSVNRKGVKESYTVLSYDPTVRHGLYRAFDRSGMVVRESYYTNGVETGKKIARDSLTGLLRNIGFISPNGDIRNFVFLFTRDGSNRYLDLIYESRQDGNSVSTIHLTEIESSLLMLTDSLRNKGANQFRLCQKYIDKQEYNLNRIGMRSENVDTLIRLGKFLLYKFFTLNENYQALKDNEAGIQLFSNQIETRYKQGIPSIYNSNLKYFQDTIREYFSRDSIEDRYRRGYELMSQIAQIQPFCDSILIMDSLIETQKTLLTQYYANKINYAVVYDRAILPVLQEMTNVYETESDLRTRLRYGVDIIKKSQPLIDLYYTLEKQVVEINNEAKTVQDAYSSRYSGKFQQELAEIEKNRVEYEQQNSPENMIRFGKKILESIKDLKADYETMVSSDALLEKTFQEDKAYYMSQEEKIYQNDFRLYEEKYLRYQEMEVISEKIEFGKTVLQDARFFHSGIDSLKYYRFTIDSLYPKICDLYKRDYRGIYQDEIKTQKVGMNDYLLTTTAREKLKKGSVLSRWMEKYMQSFRILEEQKMELESLIKRSTDEYKNGFQGVVKKEISDIRQRYNAYEDCNKLDDRIGQGKTILTDIKLTDSRYDSIAAWALHFKGNVLKIRDTLKMIFPGVFENDLTPLINRYNNLNQIQTSADLQKETQSLRNSGNEMVSRHKEMMLLRKQIKEENDLFNNKIPKERAWGLILRRSRFHYYHYDKKIERSPSYTECKTQQTALLSALQKMNSLDQTALQAMKKQLKKKHKPHEIRELFISS